MQRIAVMGHDAGSSEAIAAWTLTEPEQNYEFYAEGPARKIFAERLSLKPSQILSYDDFFDLKKLEFDLILTGVSWGSTAEREAWQIAERRKIASAALIEGWTELHNLFQLDGTPVAPRNFWVTNDALKKDLLKLGYAEKRIVRIENPYWTQMRTRVKDIEKKLSLEKNIERILYVCENISECEATYLPDSPRRGYDEFQGLEYFIDRLKKGFQLPGASAKPFSLRIRPHPSETPTKYESLLKRLSPEFSIEFSNGNLEEDLAWSHSVVGCESNALSVAIECGKRAFSCIPAQAAANRLRLPHPDIVRI